jgi:hypothetical protein
MSETLSRSRHLIAARRYALLGSAVCAALLILGIFLQPGRDQFLHFRPGQLLRSWLFGWVFWFGLSLGSLGVIMMHHLLGGGWGYLIRRFGEAASLCVPVMALLFVPIILSVWIPHDHVLLYPWASRYEVAHDAVLRHKSPFLNAQFWTLRAIGYFLLLWALAFAIRATSLQLDRGSNPRLLKRLVNFSSIGEVIYFVVMSLAAIDWIMSREPHWISTVFGFIVVISQALSAVCFLILMVALYGDEPPLKDVIHPDYLNDLGNVLLTFVILWAYLSFAQFLVTWLGNQQEEITWYIRRTDGGWRWVGAALMGLHFLVPFLVLLQRPLKRKLGRLAAIAGFVMFMRVIDVLYWIAPTDPHGNYWGALNWVYSETMNVLAFLAIGGIWFLAFLWFLKDRPILPIGDFIPVTPVDHGHGQRAVPGTVD